MTSFEEKRRKHAECQRRYAEKQPPEWMIWMCMKRRCHDGNHVMFQYYGGRGIRVCDRWLEAGTGFKNFMADMGQRPSADYSLDRIDPDKGYSKENCRWLEKAKNFASSRGCFKSEEEEAKDDEVPF